MDGVSRKRLFFFEKDNYFPGQESDLPYRLNKKTALFIPVLWKNDYLCGVKPQGGLCGYSNKSNRINK